MGIIFSVLLQAISGSSQTQAEAEASSCSSQTSKPLSQYYSQSQLEAFEKTEELKQTQTQEQNKFQELEKERKRELELEKNMMKERQSQGPEIQANPQLTSSSENSSNLNIITKRKSKPELLIHKPIKNNIPENSIDSSDTVIHEFIWKYGGKSVQLAGTFTDWQPSIFMVPLDPQCEYWKALVELDPKVSWEFKFVVDGIWRCSLDLPTITDPHNNTNNIIYPE